MRAGATTLTIVSLLAGACVVAVPARAAAPAPAAPPVAAQAWLLMDHASGQVLVSHAADKSVAPASLTKLMTAYLLFEKLEAGTLRAEERVKVSPRAAAMNGSRLDLAPGAELAVDDLLKGMLVRSANDATVALAEHASGEAGFVAAMNAKAKQLGLTATHFDNPTGLDHPAQRSSARDMTRLASRLIHDFPEHYTRYFGLREFTFHGVRQYNRNLLLWRDDTVDGIKTGRTQAAGHCLIASARRHDMRLVATVLGAQDEDARVQGAERLLAYGFDNFETYLVYGRAQPATHARVWLGAADTVPIGLADSRYVTLPRGAEGKLQRRITVAEEVIAPIRAGQTLGALRLEFDGRALAEYPLVALADLAPGNVVQRAFDQLQLWLR